MGIEVIFEYPILPILFTIFVAVFIYNTYRRKKPSSQDDEKEASVPCPKCGGEMGSRSEFWFCRKCKTKVAK